MENKNVRMLKMFAISSICNNASSEDYDKILKAKSFDELEDLELNDEYEELSIEELKKLVQNEYQKLELIISRILA